MQASSSPSLETVGKRVVDGVGLIEAMANAYVVSEAGGLYVVDTGFPGNAAPILGAFSSTGHRLEDVKGILLTHQHADHVGGAARIHWLSEAPVAIHRMDAPGAEGTGPVHAPLFVRILFKRHRVKVDNHLDDGGDVGPFTVIHLPGHTPGSVAFYHKTREWLFTGDALITGKSGRLSLSKASYSYDHEGATASLAKLAGLKVSAIFPGHGAPVTADATQTLADAVERLTQRKAIGSPTFFGPEGRPEIHPGTPGWKEG